MYIHTNASQAVKTRNVVTMEMFFDKLLCNLAWKAIPHVIFIMQILFYYFTFLMLIKLPPKQYCMCLYLCALVNEFVAPTNIKSQNGYIHINTAYSTKNKNEIITVEKKRAK